MSGIGSYAPRHMFHGGSVNKMGMMYNPVTGNYDIPHDADAVARAAEAAASGTTANTGPAVGVPLIGGATDASFVPPFGSNPSFVGSVGNEAAQKAFDQYMANNPGAQAQAKTPLPSYLYFDGNMVVPYRETNNRQMIDTLRLLGLVSDEDYAWFSNHFANERGDATWLNAYFNRPDENFQREQFFERTNFDAETEARWNRIFDSIDTASKTGGFATDDDFLMQYTDQGLRSTFGAVRPMGGTPRSPFFTTSDVLVDSSEQPNLYTYNEGQFDPMTQPAPVNPYQTPASSLAYPYIPPSGQTPTLTATTADAQPVSLADTQGRGNIFTNTVQPQPQTTNTTTTPVTTTTAPPPTPFVDEELMEMDDELKSAYGVLKFIVEGAVGDTETGREGRTGTGFLPSTVMPANVLTNKEANQVLQAWDAAGRDPSVFQSLVAGDVSGEGNKDVDPGDVAYQQGTPVSSRGMNLVPTGETGLTSTQAAIKALEERRAAEAAAANTGQFAMGGIVDLTGGMDMSMTGQGLETFLNPERSKATLRRNLAKTAPRPTMQTGIMPMAR